MSGRRPVVKIFAESLSQDDERHVVPTPLSGIRVIHNLQNIVAKHFSISIVPVRSRGGSLV
jgi:hypothetical protein